MHCVSCVAISLIGFVSDKCSFIVAFVDSLFIYGCNILRFDIFRMSTRRLYVILFVFSFREYFKNTKKPVYSYSTNPDRRFSSSTSQHFKMFLPFASSEGYSASGVRYQSDGV